MISPSTTLSSLGLPKKTLAALTNADLSTIADLIELPELDLRTKMPVHVADDVLDLLRHYNLKRPVTINREAPQPPYIEEISERVPAPEQVPMSAFVIGEAEDAEIPAWLESVSEPKPRPDGTDEAEALAEALFGSPSQKRARKSHTVTDDDRARRFATAHKKRVERGPQLDHPDDLQRLRKIRLSPTMEPIDAAWMYGVSVDVVYAELKAGRIPHTRFGRRFKIFTAHVFAQLFPDWKQPALESDESR